MRRPPPWMGMLIFMLASAIAGHITQSAGPDASHVTHNEVFQ